MSIAVTYSSDLDNLFGNYVINADRKTSWFTRQWEKLAEPTQRRISKTAIHALGIGFIAMIGFMKYDIGRIDTENRRAEMETYTRQNPDYMRYTAKMDSAYAARDSIENTVKTVSYTSYLDKSIEKVTPVHRKKIVIKDFSGNHFNTSREAPVLTQDSCLDVDSVQTKMPCPDSLNRFKNLQENKEMAKPDSVKSLSDLIRVFHLAA